MTEHHFIKQLIVSHVVKLLLEGGADMSICNLKEASPLTEATRALHLRFCGTLS